MLSKFYQKIIILIFLLVFLLPTQYTYADVSSYNNQIINIQSAIINSVPDFISKPLISITNSLETFREEKKVYSNEKIEKAKIDIQILEKKEELTTQEKFKTLLKYIELFFYKLISFILQNKVIFYASIMVLTVLIVRLFLNKSF